jgi:hypothetical protein
MDFWKDIFGSMGFWKRGLSFVENYLVKHFWNALLIYGNMGLHY